MFYTAFQLAALLIQRANWHNALAVAAVYGTSARSGTLGVPDGVKPLIALADFVMGDVRNIASRLLRAPRKLVPPCFWLYLPRSPSQRGVDRLASGRCPAPGSVKQPRLCAP